MRYLNRDHNTYIHYLYYFYLLLEGTKSVIKVKVEDIFINGSVI